MRPSDENQAPSTRPNLMSASRPGASRHGEDSILAKLERDPARRQGGRRLLRRIGYGAGAMLAVALTGTLAWLAADNGKPQPMLAQAAVPEAPHPVTAPAPHQPGAAALIDEPPPPPPPLRLLEGPRMAAPPPEPAPEQRLPAPKAALAIQAARPKAVAAAKPRPPAARPATRPAARPARTAAPPKQAEAPVDSDVALISAVIVHANGHAEAREEEARARD